MNRILAMTLVMVLLVGPVASGASWLHDGYDPARTGAVPFEGPRTNDTALAVQLPGVVQGTPRIHDGSAYVMTRADPYLREDLTEAALWRIDLATGDRTRLLSLPSEGFEAHLSPSLDLVVQQVGEELVATSVPDGEEKWRVYAWEDATREFGAERYYLDPVFQDGLIYVPVGAYNLVSGPSGGLLPSPDGAPARWAVGVLVVDEDTGEVVGSWQRPVAPPEQVENAEGVDRTSVPLEGQEERIPGGMSVTVGEGRFYFYFQSYASDSFLSAPGSDETGTRPDFIDTRYELWGVDATTMETLWYRTDTSHTRVGAETPEGPYRFGDDGGQVWCCGAAIASSTRVYIRLDEVMALAPATGETMWQRGAGASDEFRARGALGMGLRDGTVLGTSTQTVYRIDTNGDILWERTRRDTGPGRFGHGIGTTVTDQERAYVRTMRFHDGPAGYGFDVRDLDTGDLLWSWERIPEVGPPNDRSAEPAFGPGYLVWGGYDGMVHVIGETEASPEASVSPSTTYPPMDEPVTVNLSGSQAGSHGPVTRYKVAWGDGNTTGWRTDPTFTHTYNSTGDVEARFIVGNDANQTSSTFTTFHVGEDPPQEPTFLQTAFARENQEMTFGILGIAMALGGGLIGVARRYRKRSRLQDELETLEEGFQETRHDPGECEAFLDTRKARARSLLLDGVLSEEQFGVIESRVKELTRELRTGLLDERFQFLPHGMVRSLKRMLADGEINAWERSTLEDLLAEDEALNEAQRERVRGLLERWSESGEGGGVA